MPHVNDTAIVPLAPPVLTAPTAPLDLSQNNQSAIMPSVAIPNTYKGIQLQNPGGNNRCYLNSTTVGLLSIKCLRESLENMGDHSIIQGKLAKELASISDHFLNLSFFVGLIKVRNGEVHTTEHIRRDLERLHGVFDPTLTREARFREGQQNDASVCTDVLLNYIQNLNGYSTFVNKIICSGTKISNGEKCEKTVGPATHLSGLLHSLAPEDSVKEMISKSNSDIEVDFVHKCQVTKDQIKLALAQIDEEAKMDSRYKKVLEKTMKSATGDENAPKTKDNLYSLLRLKYATMEKLEGKVNRIGTAVARQEISRLENAGDFLIITAKRDPNNEIVTYPTPELTISGKKYVIRATVDHIGPTPEMGHLLRLALR